MTEQEYCNLTDLQLCRALLAICRSVNAFDDPNKTRLLGIKQNLALMIENLELSVNESIEE